MKMKNLIRDNIKLIIAGAVIIAINVLSLATLYSCDNSSSISGKASSDSDGKHKIAIFLIEGRKVEYEYTWSMAVAGLVTVHLSDGTDIEVAPENVILVESDLEECDFLRAVRGKFMG